MLISECVIQVDSVSRCYSTKETRKGFKGLFQDLIRPNKREITALHDVNFEVLKGEIIAYIGPNGAGKSTTIKLLCGVIPATTGKISVLGIDPFTNRKSITKRIGMMVGQKTRLFWNISVYESFLLYSKVFGLSTNQFEEKLADVDSSLGLHNLFKRQVRTLSLGERTKCELFLSILHSPEIIFLDEPTIGVDISTRHRIREYLLKLRNELNTTIFLTSHDVADIDAVADKVILLDRGNLLFHGSKEHFRRTYGTGDRVIEIKLDQPCDLSFLNEQSKSGILIDQNDTHIRIIVSSEFNLNDVLKQISNVCVPSSITVNEESLESILRKTYDS
ncbi:MAG: ATP-binding cassette domain-containing protein [Candidatus Aegiribacteria sp.]|nr:ATP-binding cassette domain-containing protein [Candidatus Aegiribacteria sp.]